MTDTTTPPAVPAGWYPDPSDPSRHRWWDGAAWTADVHPPQGPAVTPTSASERKKARRWIVGGAGAAAVVLFVVVAALVVGSRDDGHPSEWDPRVADIVAFVEQERGLQFTHPIEIEMVPEEEFARSVRIDDADLDEEVLDDVRASEAQLRAFGLIDGSTDLVESTSDIQSAGTLAYYSPEEEKVYVRGTELTPAVKATLAHELTHALQDQHFDLPEMEAGSPAPSAVRAIIEGDATRIENAYVERLPPAEQDAIEEENTATIDASGLDTMPDALVAVTSAPYALGEPAVGVVAAKGDDAEVNQVFMRPPTADVQVLDPQRLADDAPEPVEAPAVPDGATTIDSDDTLGALFWDIVLARRVGIHPALAFADTWAGDNYVTYDTADGRTCTSAAVRATDPAAADAMLATLDAWLAAGPQPRGEHTFTRMRGVDVVEVGVCDPGTEADAPGDDNAQVAIALAALRLELQRQALEAGQSVRAATCFGQRGVEPFDAADLAPDADPEQVQAKAIPILEAAAAACADPPG